MESLRDIITRIIEKQGPVTFERFMQIALYEPELGYYAKPETEIGRQGDFYTSPHLHKAFGAMLGLQIEEFHDIMGRPARFDIVEPGAGRGYLCLDMLDYLRGKPIYDALCYTIIERNPHLEKRQRELLSGHYGKVFWKGSLKSVRGVWGCIISNELLDAFPVRLVEQRGGILMEVIIDAGPDGFIERLAPAPEELMSYFGEFGIALADGYRTEACLSMRQWITDAANALEEGFILTVDYGYPAIEYYDEERTRGALLCYSGHMTDENPYENPGGKDITAHVNFSALKKWGEEAGLSAVGFAPQGTYLVSLGIDRYISGIAKDNDYEFELAKIKGLIMPGTMGESHKVMVQAKGIGRADLRGFALRNRIASL